MAGVPFQTGYRRALQLRCPRCGESQLFSGLIRMNERCDHCGLKYEREPGYFLGSTYLNYGWTCLSMTAAFMFLRFVMGYPARYIAPPLAVYAIGFPLIFHRYARALWLAMDCFFDHSGLPDAPPPEAPSPAAPESPEDNRQA